MLESHSWQHPEDAPRCRSASRRLRGLAGLDDVHGPGQSDPRAPRLGESQIPALDRKLALDPCKGDEGPVEGSVVAVVPGVVLVEGSTADGAELDSFDPE